MATFAALVADHGLNVVNTVQKATGELGYVAFDVEGEVLVLLLREQAASALP